MKTASFLFFLQLKTQRKTQVFGDIWYFESVNSVCTTWLRSFQ